MQLADTSPLWLLAPIAVALAVAWRLSLVDRPRAKRVASACARVVAVVLVVLALCGPTIERATRRAHVAFLVDLSASVSLEDARRALDDIDRAIGGLEPGDTWSLTSFGTTPRSHESSDEMRAILDAWAERAPDDRFQSASDLGRALDAARLTMPADAARRVVVLSDGRIGEDAALDAAMARLEREHVDVRFGALATLKHPEVAVAGIVPSPRYAHEGELVRLRVDVRANLDTNAEVRLSHRGVIIARREVELASDEATSVEFTVPMVTPGRSIWRAEVSAAEDYFAVNNSAECTVDVSGRPRVLVIHTEPREMREFERAMAQQDVVVEVREPTGLPTSMRELLAFDAVVLAKAPATDFEPQQLAMLRRYVSDFAGGLAMFGSDDSFGLGGYYQTPIEEALPLVSRFEKEKEQPSMAMVIVIDKSGSMSGAPIALARQAAKAAVDLLGPRDQIGVVAFDGQAFVALDMTHAIDRETIKSSIDRIGAGGGTFMYAGMNQAREMLQGVAAQIKHMIVLGDGMTQPADHEGLVRDLTDFGVTVSTVALGPQADRALLAGLAERGHGRYYETSDPNNVPQIFTRETMQASRSAIKEDLFSSVQIADHPLLEGFSEASLPFSLGFVMTRAKPTAQMLLATDTGEPLLAVSNYGLGTTLAFTSDLTTRWGAEWVAWPDFGRFWAQALRALVRRADADQLRMMERVDRDVWVIEAWEPRGAASAGRPASFTAEVSDDAGRSDNAEVRLSGIGRHIVRVPLESSDRLTLRVTDATSGALRVVHHERGYPREYDLTGRVAPALARAGGFDPALVREGLAGERRRVELAPWFLVGAILASIVSIVFRRA